MYAFTKPKQAKISLEKSSMSQTLSDESHNEINLEIKSFPKQMNIIQWNLVEEKILKKIRKLLNCRKLAAIVV